MAPKKRTSSGGKKSSSINDNSSQPSKFGIQHFFGRHSNTQKNNRISQSNINTNPTPISEVQIGEASNSNVVEKLQSVESEGLSELDIGRNDDVEENRIVDDVEENLLEVTPEGCKTMSVKRFKFSPGMLIKQSQDDGGDEVTWKISPVNERLHAISKHLPGMVRVLADSSRFNSMNFQPCSQRKVHSSPGKSGKLEKWLSSPPVKAGEKSAICRDSAASGNSKSDNGVNCHGKNSITNCNGKTEVFNTQSPFNTPPPLSCCQALVETDLNGIPDQLGSRQHKKALIELLEEVISEDSSCTENKISLDAARPLKDDLAVNCCTRNLKENGSKSTNLNFLVLEVCDESMGFQSPFRVLRLLNEQSGVERTLHLWDNWYYSVVAPGDTVHVVGDFDAQGKCDVNSEKNFVIVHPDILVSGTRVSSSFSCPRRTVLDDRLKQNEHSAPALIGTLLHQIFQAGLITEFPTKEFLEEYARSVLQKSLESLYACGVNESDILKTLVEGIPKILNWISCFRDSQGSRSPSIDFQCDEGSNKIKIAEVIDIEEMAWAPKYGLKGMIDASLRVRTDTDSGEVNEIVMPLEFKTGKGTTGQAAMEHKAQVMLYTLLMSERYMTNIEHGLLYYLHTDHTQGISVTRSDLIGIIMRRNDLANDLLKASTIQQLPPMLRSPNMCRGCRHLNFCTIYHKAHGGTDEGSGLGDMYGSLVSHLSTTHTIFLQRWERLVDLEARHLESTKKESWSTENSRNDDHTIFLSQLVLDASNKSSHKKSCKGNQFVYRFVQQEISQEVSLNSSPSFDSMFKTGDYVILSTDSGHIRVANGIVVDIGNSHASVSFTKRLRLPGISPSSMEKDLYHQSWRIDKDESMTSFAIMRFNLIQLFLKSEINSRLRKLIVDLEMPKFESGCIFSQDPAISYVWSETSLNDDQRRAILKILTTKDYALILGMPGTGKTTTMVHAVKALLLRGSSILLTSYTNSAVDNLLIKLKAQGVDFLRLGRYEAVHEEVKENCLSAMCINSTREIKQKMDTVKVVGVTCLGLSSPLLTNKRFDICIMDEAGQITLPVSLGPLMFSSKFVLVGDHYQLPPLVQSPEAKENGMSISLFCRLSEAHPQAIATLRSQYRMCSGIMELSNALIYGNRLRCGSAEIENAKIKYRSARSVPAWLKEVLNPNQSVIFINTDLLPAYETSERKVVNNTIEAHIIAEVTKSLLCRGIEEQDIGIITPYNAQANLIRGAIPEPVEIHTIDKYQGRDKDCILVSFVRSCENPRNNITSLLGDWHRINVALTRAKKKLIMVGSCTTLSKVPLLKLLIEKVEELFGMLVVSNNDINYKFELKRCSQIS